MSVRVSVRAVLLAAAALGVGVCAVTVYRVYGKRSESERFAAEREQRIAASVAAGREAYRAVETTPLESFASPSELGAHLLHVAAADPAAGAGDPDAREFIDQAADLIFHRFIQPSPAEYRRWMESLGYEMQPAEHMRLRERAGAAYEFRFNEPWPGDDKLAEAFDRLWSLTRELDNGRSLPVRVSASPGSVAFVRGTMDLSHEDAHLRLSSSALPPEAWHGEVSIGFRNWWRPRGGSLKDELTNRGEVPVAYLGVIMEFPPGDRYPVQFSYYQDSSGRWWLWRTNVMNVPIERLSMIEF